MVMKQKESRFKKEIDIIKSRGLFDHVKHIRQVQSPEYYIGLSESERKSFNKYMILRVLSMDPSIIEEISYISKYMEVLPEQSFYKLLIKCLPKSFQFNAYIKKSIKDPHSKILECICNKFKIGIKDSIDYYKILISHESGIMELIEIVSSFGISEKEIEELFK